MTNEEIRQECIKWIRHHMIASYDGSEFLSEYMTSREAAAQYAMIAEALRPDTPDSNQMRGPR